MGRPLRRCRRSSAPHLGKNLAAEQLDAGEDLVLANPRPTHAHRLRTFFVDDLHSRNIPPDLASRLFRKLQILDDATTDQDLLVPPSNRFERLRGKLEGFHSIRVNSQWRLVFRWDGRRGEASGLSR